MYKLLQRNIHCAFDVKAIKKKKPKKIKISRKSKII